MYVDLYVLQMLSQKTLCKTSNIKAELQDELYRT